jgi:hypothetical protein
MRREEKYKKSIKEEGRIFAKSWKTISETPHLLER